MTNKGPIKRKIAIDAVCLTGFSGGFNRYVKQLLDGLAVQRKMAMDFFLLINSRAETPTTLHSEGFRLIKVYTPSRLQYYWTQIYLPLGRIAKQFDVWHSPISVPPLWLHTKTIITVHDLAFERFPEAYSAAALVYWKTFLPKALKKAVSVIAVSENTKRDIIDFYNISEKKITVIYPSITLPTTKYENFQEIRRLYKLPEKYILYVGAIQPRKNLPTLVKAFRIAKKRMKFPHKLVIVGPRGWGLEDLCRTVEQLNLQQEVIITGVVPEEHLPLIYKGADIFVYPSLYEGFGYPPLEAMACGTPVIASNASSLPEVVGEAAVLVDPTSEELIAEKMIELLTSGDLMERLRIKGFENIKRFSMERMITNILDVYTAVCY